MDSMVMDDSCARNPSDNALVRTGTEIASHATPPFNFVMPEQRCTTVLKKCTSACWLSVYYSLSWFPILFFSQSYPRENTEYI